MLLGVTLSYKLTVFGIAMYNFLFQLFTSRDATKASLVRKTLQRCSNIAEGLNTPTKYNIGALIAGTKASENQYLSLTGAGMGSKMGIDRNSRLPALASV
jgi:hypothetical protein